MAFVSLVVPNFLKPEDIKNGDAKEIKSFARRTKNMFTQILRKTTASFERQIGKLLFSVDVTTVEFSHGHVR